MRHSDALRSSGATVVAVLTGTLLLALSLRGVQLHAGRLDVDEAFTWLLSSHSVADITTRTGADTHPPLHYLVLHEWRAVFGASAASLRFVSAIFGVLGVWLLYLTCLAVFGNSRGRPGGRAMLLPAAAALTAAALLALNFLQVNHGRNIRMYSQGVFLAVLSAWLLLKALDAQRRRPLWWGAYGLCVAAFCYTHSFAFFTVLAQAVFVAGDLLLRARRDGWRGVRPAAIGFVSAGCLALVLYSPWLPVLRAQSQTVLHDFWIPDVTFARVGELLARWTFGLPETGIAEQILATLVVGALVLFAVFRPSRGGWFFLLQAGVPFLLSIGISVASGRSIFLERCLLFAQLSLFGLVGVTLARLPGLNTRILLAATLLLANGYGIWVYMARLPTEPPAELLAAQYLKEHYEPGDVIIVSSTINLARLSCYCHSVGLNDLQLRSSSGGGPKTGKSWELLNTALSGEQVIAASGEPPPDARRIWYANEGTDHAIAGGKEQPLHREHFQSPDGTQYNLVCYPRDE